MLLKNTSDHKVAISDLGGLVVHPGGVIDIPDSYCNPRKAPNGNKLKSIIEMLAPQLVPADSKLVAAWRARTLDLETPAPASKSTSDLVADGVAPGIAALMAAGDSESVAKVNKTIPVQAKPSAPKAHE